METKPLNKWIRYGRYGFMCFFLVIIFSLALPPGFNTAKVDPQTILFYKRIGQILSTLGLISIVTSIVFNILGLVKMDRKTEKGFDSGIVSLIILFLLLVSTIIPMFIEN